MEQDMPFKVVRHSKFRHVYGKPHRKEKCYDGINISRNAHDNNFCAANPLFVAVVTESAGGGSFVVIPLENVGRIGFHFSKVCGHSGAVMDIKWDPYDDNIIASAAEDGSVRIWYIPDNGLTENLDQAKMVLTSHTRRCNAIEWHPTAKNILASVGYDLQLILWNVGTGEIAFKLDCHPDIIYSLSFSWDGSRIATACKDKKIRILDPRTGEIIQSGTGHPGFKSSKIVYAGDTGRFITTGFTRNSNREIYLWDQDNLSGPMATLQIDMGTGVLFPFYDADSNVVYIAGKGDSSIRYYEILSEKPYMFYLNQYQSSGPQRGLGFMPKRGVDAKANEVVRFYKLHASKSLCEPISMIVPRKGEAFQSDLFPDTVSSQAALTADEWISGVDAPPLLMSLGGIARTSTVFPPAPTPAKVPLRESTIKNTDNIPPPKPSVSSSTMSSTSSSSSMTNKPMAIVTGINKSEQEIQPVDVTMSESAPVFEKENIKREDSETSSIKEKSERELLEKDVNVEEQEQPPNDQDQHSLTSSSKASIFEQWKNREAENKNGAPVQTSSLRESRKLRDHPFQQMETASTASSTELESMSQEQTEEESRPSSYRSPLSSTSVDDIEVERSVNEEGREVFRINMSPTRQPSVSSDQSNRAPSVSDSTARRQASLSTEPQRAPALADTNRRSVSVSDERPYSSSVMSIANRFSLGSNGNDRRHLEDEPLLTSKDMGMDQLRKAYLRQQEEIKQLKSKILLKDQRIRQLERELDQLNN